MAATYQTEPIYAGDTWPGIPTISFATPQDAPAASASMVFFRSGMPPGRSPATGTELVSGNGINIVDPTAWIFAVPPRILPLDPGDWAFKFKATDASGTVRTWLTGTLTIL